MPKKKKLMIKPKGRNALSILAAALMVGSAQVQADDPTKQAPEASLLGSLPRTDAKAHRLKRKDRANLRATWQAAWFGGPASPDDLKPTTRTAAGEAAAWSHLLSRPGELCLAPGSTTTWINLGPHATAVLTVR